MTAFNNVFAQQEHVRLAAAFGTERDAIRQEWAAIRTAFEKSWPRHGHKLLFIIHEGDDDLGNEDANDLITEINLLGKRQPIDLIIHSPGGLALAAERIAAALVKRRNAVAFVPFYAWSGGTEIALATSRIYLGNGASLSPTDIQFGGVPAWTIVKMAHDLGSRASEQLRAAAEIATKALKDETSRTCALINGRHKGGWWRRDRCRLAATLTSGEMYHGRTLDYKTARSLGVRATRRMPRSVYELVSKRRAQLRLLREIDSQIAFVQTQAQAPRDQPASALLTH